MEIKVGQIWKGTELCDFDEVVILSNINNEGFSIYFMDRAGYTYSRSAQYIRKRLTYIGESCVDINDLFKVKGG